MNKEEYMDDLNIRISRITEDLRAIQKELNCAAMQAPTDPELMETLSDLAETESLQILKSAIDQMRHFLWFYFQVMTEDSEAGEHLRNSLRQTKTPNKPAPQPKVTETSHWPSDAALIRMLADGRNRKPN